MVKKETRRTTIHFPKVLFPEAVRLLKLESILHAEEILAEIRNHPENPEIRPLGREERWFYCSDGATYTIEDNQPILYLSRNTSNPNLLSMHEGTHHGRNDQYTQKQIQKKELERTQKAAGTTRIPLEELGICWEHGSSMGDAGTLYIPTIAPYGKPNKTDWDLIQHLIGKGSEFEKTMRYLREEENIDEINIHVEGRENIERRTREGFTGFSVVVGLMYKYKKLSDSEKGQLANIGLPGWPCIDYIRGELQLEKDNAFSAYVENSILTLRNS